MATAFAAAHTWREAGAPFGSIWGSLGLGVLIVLLGTFLERRLEMRRIRKFLPPPLTDPNSENAASPSLHQ
jgi:hypothetical protein